MLKRRDWQLLKGGEGADSSSDSSSEEVGGSEEEHSLEESESEESGLEEPGSRRLEDLSEDDFEEADEEDNAKAEADAASLKEQWLAATKIDAEKVRGGALACRLCKGILMLGPASLRQHMESKQHQKRLMRKSDDFEPICFATGHTDDSTVETHKERLIRLKAVAEQQRASIESGKTRRAQKRNLKLRRMQSKGKPGKRQRAELKLGSKNQAGTAALSSSLSHGKQASDAHAAKRKEQQRNGKLKHGRSHSQQFSEAKAQMKSRDKKLAGKKRRKEDYEGKQNESNGRRKLESANADILRSDGQKSSYWSSTPGVKNAAKVRKDRPKMPRNRNTSVNKNGKNS